MLTSAPLKPKPLNTFPNVLALNNFRLAGNQRKMLFKVWLFFCTTGLLLASSWMVWSTFLRHFHLSSNQPHWFTSAMSIFFPLKIFGNAGIQTSGQLGRKRECLVSPSLFDIIANFVLSSECLDQMVFPQPCLPTNFQRQRHQFRRKLDDVRSWSRSRHICHQTRGPGKRWKKYGKASKC